MNIKKLLPILLSVCMLFALSVNVFAEVNLDDYAYYAEDGSLMYDMDAYHFALATDLVAHSGVEIEPADYWITDPYTGNTAGFDYDSFRADYDSAIVALAPEVIEDEPVEEVINELPDDVEDPVLEDVLETETVDPVLESQEDIPMVYTVNDLRVSLLASEPTDGTYYPETEVVESIKSILASIFGTYEPVTTTAVYLETVDGETVTTLVDVVADGAAGVDYEYLSGVLIFCIMLFCLFRLLGGILS